MSRRNAPIRAFRTALFVAVLLGLRLGQSAVPPAHAQTEDYKLAPAPEELDARSDAWIRQRRWMAILIVGGTFVAGAAGSVIRRRQRKVQGEGRPEGGS